VFVGTIVVPLSGTWHCHEPRRRVPCLGGKGLCGLKRTEQEEYSRLRGSSHLPGGDSMSQSPLRSYTTFLVFLGWLHVVLFTLLGFAPWLIFPGQPILGDSWWGQWALYASPAVGLLVGAVTGLGYFILSGVIRVFIDQRDLLEDLLLTNRRLLQIVESLQPGGRPPTKDPFDLTDLKDGEETMP